MHLKNLSCRRFVLRTPGTLVRRKRAERRVNLGPVTGAQLARFLKGDLRSTKSYCGQFAPQNKVNLETFQIKLITTLISVRDVVWCNACCVVGGIYRRTLVCVYVCVYGFLYVCVCACVHSCFIRSLYECKVTFSY